MRSFLSFLLIFFAIVAQADFVEPVPFKRPVDIGKFEHELNLEGSNVAIISGAGPAGLLAAHAIVQTKRYSHVIVTEFRDTFSRSNTLSTRKQVLTRFQELNLLELYKKISVFSQRWNFRTIAETGESKTIEDEYSPDLLSVDYEQPVQEFYKVDADSHFAVEISQLQKMLADEATKHPNVYLLNGTLKVVINPSGMNDAVITLSGDSVTILKPRLIIIAEGTKSQNRENIGIGFVPVNRPDEHWCSGVVSLENIVAKSKIFGDISLVRNLQEDHGGFGVVRPQYHDFFVNSIFRPSDGGKIEKCLERAARLLLINRNHQMEMNLRSDTPLHVVAELSSEVQIVFKKADKAFVGLNTVVLGDAHRSGSPVGGLGLSMVATVENYAITKLSLALFDESTRLDALQKYQNRLNEIADFWHFGGLL